MGTSSLLAVTTMLTGVADVSMLWVTSPICGLLYGANWSLMPALASEFFGLSHFGVNYCVLSTSIGIGSFLVSNVLVSSQSSRPLEFRWLQLNLGLELEAQHSIGIGHKLSV